MGGLVSASLTFVQFLGRNRLTLRSRCVSFQGGHYSSRHEMVNRNSKLRAPVIITMRWVSMCCALTGSAHFVVGITRSNTHSYTTNDKYTRKNEALPLHYHILNQSFKRLFVRPPQYSYSWLPPSCSGFLTRRSCPVSTIVKGRHCPFPPLSPSFTVAYDWSNDSDDFLSHSKSIVTHLGNLVNNGAIER